MDAWHSCASKKIEQTRVHILTSKTHYILARELNSWVESSGKYILQIYFLYYVFKNSIHKFSPWCPISVISVKGAESGWNRKANDFKEKFLLQLDVCRLGDWLSSKDVPLVLGVWAHASSVPLCSSSPTALSSALNLCLRGATINLARSPTLRVFSLGWVFKADLSVSTDLWEVYHVSPFKQVVEADY